MKRFLFTIVFVSLISSFVIAEPKNADKPLPSGPKPKDRPSVALVLAGGGAKGFAHLPVIELIEQVGIPIDMVVGTSIGSIIGGMYAAGYSTTEILKEFNDVDWTPMFRDGARSPYENTLDNYSLNQNLFSLNFGLDLSMKLGKGLSSGQNVYQLLKNLTLKYPSNTNFNDLNIPFRAVVTDMLTGEALVLDEGDLAEAIRASMSLPSIFEPAEIDGYYFMDGGVRYNLAINVAKNMGYDIIIAVDISQKVRDNPEVYSSNPAVAMLNTITISQYTATQAMYKDADLVIFPDISKYGTLAFKDAEKIYKEGSAICDEYEPKLEELRRKIYPNDYDKDGNRLSEKQSVKKRGNYRKRPNLIPTELVIKGALTQDEKFIQNSFDDIFDKELT
ncbi:MAG: patatin-like phospholipase family protein, partial [Treponema sp.]|nr:patatin-like phospholipase family protein [Treponema sp.]